MVFDQLRTIGVVDDRFQFQGPRSLLVPELGEESGYEVGRGDASGGGGGRSWLLAGRVGRGDASGGSEVEGGCTGDVNCMAARAAMRGV